MAVDRHARAHLATEQLIQWQPGLLTLDVPQGHIDAGNGVVLDRPVAPVGVLVHQLPEFLDRLGVAADQQRFEILFDKAFDGDMPVGKSRAAQPVQAGLVGIHPHDHQIDALRRGQDDPHVRDYDRHLPTLPL